jgi:RsgA GTPase
MGITPQGDRVVISKPEWQGQRGAISEVLPRRSELERSLIANADQVLLVFAMADPVIDVYQLNRFLVAPSGTYQAGVTGCGGHNQLRMPCTVVTGGDGSCREIFWYTRKSI